MDHRGQRPRGALLQIQQRLPANVNQSLVWLALNASGVTMAPAEGHAGENPNHPRVVES